MALFSGFIRLIDRVEIGNFFRYSIVGVIGFLVDAVALYGLLTMGFMNAYVARLPSYLCAATVTWKLHRTFTFKFANYATPHRQWAKFVSVNAVGMAVNYGVYCLALYGLGTAAFGPLIALACGSATALAFNFQASRTFVFK